MNDLIEIKNARIHNLKGVDVKIPRGKLTVITGVSGSGKSSLAFDTLYEEGRRRYLMFSGMQLTADSVSTFDSISGLSPTVAVEQRIIRQSNPRSTVGTRTSLSAMLAVLFASYGKRESKYDDGMPLAMNMFQKFSPAGMCPKCLGVGKYKKINEEAIYGDTAIAVKDVLEGKLHKIPTWGNRIADYYKHLSVSPDQTLASLTSEQFIALKYGSPKTQFTGVNSYVPVGDHTYASVENPSPRQRLFLYSRIYAEEISCPRCGGSGLGEMATHTTIGGKTIAELENMYISELRDFLVDLTSEQISQLHREIITKLDCIMDVGLHHLSLSRPVPTLSGGEIQRLFLASYIITEMDSIIFVFDEPTIGLHEIEKEKLISIIKRLVERGNTVVAVEHDENFMRAADYIIDLGPDAGIGGGLKIFEGGYADFLTCVNSRTAPYLSNKKGFHIKPETRPVITSKTLKISEARLHNLRNVSADFPLNVMVGVAGVSGSGKSSLVSDTLVPLLKQALKSRFVNDEDEITPFDNSAEFPIIETKLSGYENIKKCIVIDQKPIGRSRTSCPATYTGIFDRVRTMFARESGMPAGLFSANSEGGCRVCHGEGVVHHYIGMGNFIDMDCEACGTTGFIPEECETLVDGKNIRDILNMTVDEAKHYFEGKDKVICEMLSTLRRVGMGYIKLGQKTPTISGGESQRIKLARELVKIRKSSDVLYILDEPTTGLSFYDSEKLMELLQEIVDGGGSVIITEHDPYVLSNCDYIVELGPGGGSDGGYIIATGRPAELKVNSESIIGRYLK
ncbi:MAG: ABC transporter [Oscillospiraceae bacterium]|nr:ABC transporter [Oscillospiraceae bacterium]